MTLWQPQSTSYGGALEMVQNTDFGLSFYAQQYEASAKFAGMDRDASDTVSRGLVDTENPANVKAIQERVAFLQHTLAQGGTITGLPGFDQSGYIGTLALAGQQFAAPSYSNRPDLTYGNDSAPAAFGAAALSYADFSSPAWSNAYSDISPLATPAISGAGAAITSIASGLGGLFAGGGEETTMSTASASPAHSLPEVGTAGMTVFLPETSTVGMHLNLGADVQERLAGIASSFKSFDLAGGAQQSSLSQVSMPTVPTAAAPGMSAALSR